jgi:hypothetical protein
MGRPPSLGAAQRRPTRARIIINDPSSPDDAAAAAVLTSPANATPASVTSPNSVSSTPQFPRRAPRTGTAYQHKVPAYEPTNGPAEVTLSRPAPLLMSRDAPHETASVMEQSLLLEATTTTTTGMYYLILFIRENRS